MGLNCIFLKMYSNIKGIKVRHPIKTFDELCPLSRVLAGSSDATENSPQRFWPIIKNFGLSTTYTRTSVPRRGWTQLVPYTLTRCGLLHNHLKCLEVLLRWIDSIWIYKMSSTKQLYKHTLHMLTITWSFSTHFGGFVGPKSAVHLTFSLLFFQLSSLQEDWLSYKL